MEKLKTAVAAYCISHTEHAYAQQLLILALLIPKVVPEQTL